MLCLNGFSLSRYSAVLRFAKFSILTSSLEVETFLCYLLSLLFFYPSGISHSFVSSTRWRKFLWVLLGGLLASRFARALSRERGIQLQFAADSFCMMTIPSFLVKDNAKTFFFFFFAKMMKMMKAILAAAWHLLDKYSFATPDLYFLLPKFRVWCGSGGREQPLMREKQQH